MPDGTASNPPDEIAALCAEHLDMLRQLREAAFATAQRTSNDIANALEKGDAEATPLLALTFGRLSAAVTRLIAAETRLVERPAPPRPPSRGSGGSLSGLFSGSSRTAGPPSFTPHEPSQGEAPAAAAAEAPVPAASAGPQPSAAPPPAPPSLIESIARELGLPESLGRRQADLVALLLDPAREDLSSEEIDAFLARNAAAPPRAPP